MSNEHSTITCVHCGTTWQGETACGSKHANGSYCSQECANKADNEYLKKRKQELEALGYVVKAGTHCRFDFETEEWDHISTTPLKVYKIDWNKVLAWSYANGEFVIVEVCDRNGRWHTMDVAGHLYRLCGYSIHNNGKDKKFHTYSLSCFPFNRCRLPERTTPKDEWLTELTAEEIEEVMS